MRWGWRRRHRRYSCCVVACSGGRRDGRFLPENNVECDGAADAVCCDVELAAKTRVAFQIARHRPIERRREPRTRAGSR
jgi:hypothetical protein